jgi:cyclopropane fatty-acyl-phospholipid synthase-like methyltransferase
MKEKYKHDQITHNTRAATYIVPELINLLRPKSVIDLGCGIGSWLKVFIDNGVNDVLGVDYPGIDRKLLYVEEKLIIEHDLEHDLLLNKKFDLAICVEVVEHLKEMSSDVIVETLTKLSNNILFSAAIPFQGGDNHINEKWFEFWFEKFEKQGFVIYDLFRDKHWNNSDIEWWYKQNLFFISKGNLNLAFYKNTYIHPELYLKKNEELQRFYNGAFPIAFGVKFFFKTILFKLRNLFKKQ